MSVPRGTVELLLHTLERVGIDVRDAVRLSAQKRDVDDATYRSLWRAAEERGLMPQHALEMARHYLVGAVGPADIAAFTAPTVRGALDVLSRAWAGVSGAGEHLRVHTRGAALHVTLEHRVPDHPMADAFALAAIVDRLRLHAAGPVALTSASLVLARPAGRDGAAQAEAFTRFFGAPVRWAATHSGIQLAPAAGDTPLTTSSQVLHARVVAMVPAEEDLDALAAAVRRHLHARASIEDVAAALRLTPRTLQRRLAAHGLTFRGFRDGLAIEHARWMLTDGCSIADVAEAVGFADASTFTRAFRRFTGEAPGSYRARHGTPALGQRAVGTGASARNARSSP